MFKEDKLVAVGNTIHAHIDLKTKKKIPLSDDLRNKFNSMEKNKA
jgi:acyl-CoA thioesterase FadM